ncbi:MAG: carbohydrate-binding domain-containing protein, partial [Oscillospiraceae bacterium]|nr:carbohydrate-binding domain-containing protein [Oscillospiraceae bacterium]
MKGKTLFASVMMGTLLLAGCSAQKTGDAAETQAASAGSEHTITLSGSTASCSSASVTIDGGTITITGAGTYELTGTLDDGMVIVNAGDEDDVELVLNNASITSGTSAAIYIANCGDATVTLAAGSENALTNGGSF